MNESKGPPKLHSWVSVLQELTEACEACARTRTRAAVTRSDCAVVEAREFLDLVLGG